MMKSFWKTVPALALALSVGAYAQVNEVALSDLAGKDRGVGRTRSGTVPCGIVEGNQCYARGCSMSMGGAFEFEFLYWRAENLGFRSAWNVTGPTDSTGLPLERFAGSILRPEAVWNPGFRLGMGWNTTHDRWDLFFNWTWYKNHSNADGSVPDTTGGKGLYSVDNGMIWEDNNIVGPYRTVHSSWKLWHNCFDMELGRAYYLTKQLSLRNHWGVRGAVLKQKMASSFSDPAPSSGAFNAETLRLLNKFWGIGPRAGVQTKYHVGKGFSVVGKGAVALLFGQQKWKSKDWGYSLNVPGTATAIEMAKTGEQTQTLVPNLNLFFGMEWATCFSCEEIFFGMEAGWEANYWMNQYAISTLQAKATNDPVTMEGLTVSFHIDY